MQNNDRKRRNENLSPKSKRAKHNLTNDETSLKQLKNSFKQSQQE